MVLMTEQADRPVTPLPAPEQLSGRDSRGNRSEADPGGERRRRRRGGSPGGLQLCLDTEADPSEGHRKPAGMRPKAAERPSPLPSPKVERKKSQHTHLSKTNGQYHKLFKEVRREELLKQSYTCALQRDILYQGKMFVSDNWICFHSKVFGRDTKISIPAASVTFIKKTKTALLVPNALVIETISDQHVFVSFLSRNNTYKLLNSICIHLDVDKTCSSSFISSCENSFRGKCPTSLPLDFSADFSRLGGVVQQRRQEMMESSSSGSQTPDYDKISGSTKLKDKPLQPASLQAVLLLYLFLVAVLVLSSCYMAFKIVALEHRLNSLVSVGRHVRAADAVSQRPPEDVSAEIYGELSSNLFKLEKIQRNLRKLLEET
ncbi:GRAM domain-containing protein 2B-like isoform X3 [Pungitius pungitius]|uniref:GRAM domain-containing protein 2B-like isoform X3 n=1 Tax=Pungitius pungitius TaxID=134920 RepID=UPI002E1576F2